MNYTPNKDSLSTSKDTCTCSNDDDNRQSITVTIANDMATNDQMSNRQSFIIHLEDEKANRMATILDTDIHYGSTSNDSQQKRNVINLDLGCLIINHFSSHSQIFGVCVKLNHNNFEDCLLIQNIIKWVARCFLFIFILLKIFMFAIESSDDTIIQPASLSCELMILRILLEFILMNSFW